MDDTHKKVKTGMLILIWVSMGLSMEIGGPTMLDLKLRFNTHIEDIARSVSAQGVGIFIGALIGGLLVDVLGKWKDVLISVAQLLSFGAIIAMPFAGSISVLWFMFFIIGTASGINNVVGQRLLFEMWQSKAASPMHALHTGFGIGAVAAPLIANNFLAVLKFRENGEPSSNTTTTTTSLQNQTTVTESEGPYIVIEESRVQYAYVVIGLISAVISIPFFVYPFLKCCNKSYRDYYNNLEVESSAPVKSKLLNMINPATYADGSLKFGLFVFIIVLLFFTNLVGGEQLFGNFVRTFSVDELKFTRDEASYLDTAYWGSFTVGRFTGSLLAYYVPIRALLVIDVILNLVAVTFLVIFSGSSHTLLWVFTVIVGFSISPLFPAFISFTNTQIEVGGVVLTLIVFATGFGDMFYIWIAGVLYEDHGPKTVLYAMEISAVLVFVIAAIFVGCTLKRDRFVKQLRTVTDVDGLIDDKDTNVSYTRMKDS